MHKRARTNPAIRKEIQQSPLSKRSLAKQYNITRATVRKWKKRDSVEDQSHRPHSIQASLSSLEEIIVVELRQTLLLPLDDLLAIVRACIQPTMSRSALDRCLRRHGVSDLNKLLPIEDQPTGPEPSFKAQAPGVIRLHCRHLPQPPDVSDKKNLLIAVDRATRWLYLEISVANGSQDFLEALIQKAPFLISKILTNNDTEFTNRFSATGPEGSTKQHPFGQVCARYNLEHRLIRFGVFPKNRRIRDILDQTHFGSAIELHEMLHTYVQRYNHHITQDSLGGITPIQALVKWQQSHPMLFDKSVYNQAGFN